jgi:hypothetical protein
MQNQNQEIDIDTIYKASQILTDAQVVICEHLCEHQSMQC